MAEHCCGAGVRSLLLKQPGNAEWPSRLSPHACLLSISQGSWSLLSSRTAAVLFVTGSMGPSERLVVQFSSFPMSFLYAF